MPKSTFAALAGCGASSLLLSHGALFDLNVTQSARHQNYMEETMHSLQQLMQKQVDMMAMQTKILQALSSQGRSTSGEQGEQQPG